MFDIQEELKKLPGKTGVYIMHDAKDDIIYVGKAVSLKNRVRQYFQSSRNLGIKKEQMVQQIARFEYIITDSELEALVLEQGWYPNTGSLAAGAAISSPPTYPVHAIPDPSIKLE